MQENTTAISQRETYAPGKWTRFLWWLSTAEQELLTDCVIDRNRYAIVGMTVLGTWAFATLAWTYFFSTVVSNLFVSVLLGFFMGGMILTIDRSLIKGINRSNRKSFIPLLFRGLLAVIIGLFMAQPALLYLFDKEIHVQVSLDNEQRKKDKKQKQDSVFYAERNILQQKKINLQQELNSRYAEVSAARDAFIRETDGTGVSKKIGLKDIAQVKQREYEKLDADYRIKESQILPQLKANDSALNVIDVSMQKEQAAFATLLNDGFITRIEALNHLVKDNSAVAFRYYLLVAILLLIELMPVISKILLPAGTYDEKILLRERIEKELTQKNHERELALKELYNQTAFEQDTHFIKDFFNQSEKERREKMQEQINTWKEKKTKSFDGLWDDMKKDMLTKQEN
jgi:phosphate/sulfate permease